MRKIMIYSNRGNIAEEGLIGGIRQNGALILLFTAFCCGMLTGCFIMRGAGEGIRGLCAADLAKDPVVACLSYGGLYVTGLVLLAFTGALSCFGVLMEVFINFAHGCITSALMSYVLINDSYAGFGKLCSCVLLGEVLFSCAMLLYSSSCVRISGELCAEYFFEQKQKSNFKLFLIKTMITVAASGIALLLTALLISVLK